MAKDKKGKRRLPLELRIDAHVVVGVDFNQREMENFFRAIVKAAENILKKAGGTRKNLFSLPHIPAIVIKVVSRDKRRRKK